MDGDRIEGKEEGVDVFCFWSVFSEPETYKLYIFIVNKKKSKIKKKKIFYAAMRLLLHCSVYKCWFIPYQYLTGEGEWTRNGSQTRDLI